MPSPFACPSCNTKLRAKPGQPGKRVKCPRCKHIVALGADGTPLAATEAAAPREAPAAPPPMTLTPAAPQQNPMLHWDIVCGEQASREAQRQGLKPQLSNPDVFAAALLTPTAMPASNFVDLTGRIHCNACQRTFDFKADFVLGADMGGNAKCPCGNRFTWLVANEKQGCGLFLMVYPDTVPARTSGGVALEITGLSVRPANSDVTPAKQAMTVYPKLPSHTSTILFRETCAACGDDTWAFFETWRIARFAGWALKEDTVVPATGAEETESDYEDRERCKNALGVLRPAPTIPKAAALDDRKGFKCENVLCGALLCMKCLRGRAEEQGCTDLTCLECGRPVRRVPDDSGHQYNRNWSKDYQGWTAEMAEGVFDFATNRFKYPILRTHALRGPLELGPDGKVVGGGWNELNKHFCQSKSATEDAVVVCVTPGKAFAGVSRSLRGRVPWSSLDCDGRLRPVLLALALFDDFALLDGGDGVKSRRMEVSSRLAACRNEQMPCGYFLGTLAFRTVVEQFGGGGGNTLKAGSALRKLILTESTELTEALIAKYATRQRMLS